MKTTPTVTLCSPHVRFGAIPKPDHVTGEITYSIPSPESPRPIQLRTPAYGLISQRRVQKRDERGDQFVLEAFRAWQEDNPGDGPPVWKEVGWIDAPHPGNRVPESKAPVSGLRRLDQGVDHMSANLAYSFRPTPQVQQVMGAAFSHIHATVTGTAQSPQTLPNNTAVRDFAQAPACCCRVDHLCEWTMCLAHEMIMADTMSSNSARDSQSEAEEHDAAEDRSYAMLLRRFHAGEPPAVSFVVDGEELRIRNRDFGYDNGWAEVFASTAPGGEVVDAPMDDEGDHAEQFAFSDMDQRAEAPLQADLTRSRFSDDSDSSSYTSDDGEDYDEDGNEIFRLRLPVFSPLARRRYLAQGEDIMCVAREQSFKLAYEVDRRKGKIIEPGDLFREVDWNQQSGTGKTEDVSPGTLPQAVRVPGRKNAIVAATWAGEHLESQVDAYIQAQNEWTQKLMRETVDFQPFPSPQPSTASFAIRWDDDLVIVDTRNEMERQAQNQESHQRVLSRAREMHRLADGGRHHFPSPPPYEWSIGTISDAMFGGTVEYL